ncbi:MAG: LacI family DNA-binding transcriptional regulator [Propionibacteriales bacterium]|nr:LacI family DNA-binding transcriptional regulator [Propionibacteriales bacterium]
MPPGRKPTIADVARRANVSKGAVSFALNDRPGVSAATKARILAAAAELGWSASSTARALSSAKAFAVGLVVAREPELLGADPFFAPFIAGVESVLAPRGQALVLQVVPEGEEELASYRRIAATARADGVFLTDLRLDDQRPALLQELGLAGIAVGHARGERVLPTVALDDRAGITAAVEHLVAFGHRRIAHVAGPNHFVHGADRQQAFVDAVDRAGLPAPHCVAGDFSAAGGAAATTELLELPDRPTAIVYANDLMAIAGMQVLAARGLSVPDDISVTGYDDTEIAAHLAPPLTTVATDVLSWGAAAATSLLALVDGTDPGDVELPAAALVVRHSSGPAPTPTRPGR